MVKIRLTNGVSEIVATEEGWETGGDELLLKTLQLTEDSTPQVGYYPSEAAWRAEIAKSRGFTVVNTTDEEHDPDAIY